MRMLRSGIWAATVLLLATACTQQDAPPPQEPGAAPAAAGDRPAREPRKERGERENVDRGSASMTIGGESWSAGRASARLRGDRLRIGASNTERGEGTVRRESLTLVIEGYAGPGEYRSNPASSSFTRVSMDLDKAQAAGDDEQAAAAVAMQSIAGADHVPRIEASITITAANDEFIDGVFEWSSGGTEIREGRFHAGIRR